MSGRRRVFIDHDGTDFVATDTRLGVIYRHRDDKELRKVCQWLDWEIVESKTALEVLASAELSESDISKGPLDQPIDVSSSQPRVRVVGLEISKNEIDKKLANAPAKSIVRVVDLSISDGTRDTGEEGSVAKSAVHLVNIKIDVGTD